jgi:cellulose synthase (UDP-forming)
MAAVLWAFYVNGGGSEIHYSSPALAWTWYNLVVLVVLCFVCIERPRKRTAERFASRDLVSVKTPDRTQLMQLAYLSITGAHLWRCSWRPGRHHRPGAADFSRFSEDRSP